MFYPTTITQKWQMTIPKGVRLLLGWQEPGEALIEVVDKKKKLLRLSKKPSFLELAGTLPAKNKRGKKIDILKTRDYMEKHYERL